MKLRSGIFVALLSVHGSVLAGDNLSTCLDGRYPVLCDHTVLKPDEKVRVQAAERNANYSTCLIGKYPALCRHQDLTSDEHKQVVLAEHRENLATCLIGKYPALCRHNDLSADESILVKAAELRENYAICISGRYPALCAHDKLSSDQRVAVAASEKQNKIVTNSRATPAVGTRHAGGSYYCDSGHWVEEVMSDGEIVKLEDGTLWEISGGDQVDTALWLPTTEITVGIPGQRDRPFRLNVTDDSGRT
jgi:hypothetical protein